MNPTEISDRVSALPGRFTDRLDAAGLDDVATAARAGEWGEAVDVLLAGLVKTQVPVSGAERDELLALLTAMGMPTEPVARLNVRD